MPQLPSSTSPALLRTIVAFDVQVYDPAGVLRPQGKQAASWALGACSAGRECAAASAQTAATASPGNAGLSRCRRRLFCPYCRSHTRGAPPGPATAAPSSCPQPPQTPAAATHTHTHSGKQEQKSWRRRRARLCAPGCPIQPHVWASSAAPGPHLPSLPCWCPCAATPRRPAPHLDHHGLVLMPLACPPRAHAHKLNNVSVPQPPQDQRLAVLAGRQAAGSANAGTSPHGSRPPFLPASLATSSLTPRHEPSHLAREGLQHGRVPQPRENLGRHDLHAIVQRLPVEQSGQGSEMGARGDGVRAARR